MTEDTREQYFIVKEGGRVGPLTKEDLKRHNIQGTTLVWRAGLDDWVKAEELMELSEILYGNPTAGSTTNFPEPPSAPSAPHEPRKEWFAMFSGVQAGPMTAFELAERGADGSTPVWREGMVDWGVASDYSELMEHIMRRSAGTRSQQGFTPNGHSGNNSPYGPPYQNGGWQTNPNTNPYDPYGQSNPYGNNQFNVAPPTNWLPWAIAATVVGFLFSCIGGIFGIIGIVQANKANSFYAAGNKNQGDNANSNAKTMTIIGLCFGGLGLLASLFTGSLYSWFFGF